MNKEYDVLIVEDESVVLAAIKKILEPEKIVVDAAVDVESALEKLRRNIYRLIISDLMLPKISGYDFIRVIKEKYPYIPLIVITGYATLENALQSFNMGSFDFIPKPFDTEALLGVIQRGMKYSEKMHALGPNKQVCFPLSLPPRMGQNLCGLHCLGHHAWAKLEENGTALIGVGDTFPEMIKDLDRIEFHLSNDEIIQGKCCARLISKNGLVNMFWAPLSGSVTAINHELESNVQLVNTSPFDEGWLFRIIPVIPAEELKHLTCCEKRSAH
ncbi:MAG: response regulator [Candidatus Aminicenantaceae bacterium]